MDIKSNEAYRLLVEKFNLDELPDSEIFGERADAVGGVDMVENDRLLEQFAECYKGIFNNNSNLRPADHICVRADEPVVCIWAESYQPIRIRNTQFESMLEKDKVLFDGSEWNGWFYYSDDDSDDIEAYRLNRKPDRRIGGRFYFTNDRGVETECYETRSVTNELEVAEKCDQIQIMDTLDYYPDSYKRIYSCYKAMAERGIAEANRYLAKCHTISDKSFMNKDIIGFLLEGARLGDTLSMRDLSLRFQYSSPERFVKWMCVAAHKKERDSMWNLAQLYLSGQYVRRNVDKAVDIYRDILNNHYDNWPDNRYLYPDDRLITWTEHNLRIITGEDRYWERYFEPE